MTRSSLTLVSGEVFGVLNITGWEFAGPEMDGVRTLIDSTHSAPLSPPAFGAPTPPSSDFDDCVAAVFPMESICKTYVSPEAKECPPESITEFTEYTFWEEECFSQMRKVYDLCGRLGPNDPFNITVALGPYMRNDLKIPLPPR